MVSASLNRRQPRLGFGMSPPDHRMDRSTFVGELEKCGLLVDPRIKLRVHEHDTQTLDGRSLARVLLQQDLLTAYQANQLLASRGNQLVLGPCVLLERLGQGGMGQVYKAYHRALDRIVAIKVLSRELLNDERALARFQREIEAAGKVTHPNIVTALDASEVDGVKFLVMDYIEGIDLGRLVKEMGVLPVDLACHCIHQAALGLQHAHERGLVHRDLKPSNLLLQGSKKPSSAVLGKQGGYGTVKILDLGLARFQKPRSARTDRSHLTQVDQIMGTPDFMSPEQARDSHKANHLSDIYSLGTTFYYCLAGRPPFPEGNPLEKLLAHQFDEPIPLDRMRPDVPSALLKLIKRMMSKHPSKRPQSAAEVAASLEAWCDPKRAPVAQFALDVTPLPLAVADQVHSSQSTLHFVPANARLLPSVRRRDGKRIRNWLLTLLGVVSMSALLVWLMRLVLSSS